MSTIEQVKPGPVRTGERTGPLGWWDNGRTFLTEVRNEMRRVTWPSRKEVWATTIVVIITSAFFGLYLFGLDLILNAAVNWIFTQLGAA
ncbi:MAG: preprotein translocase subunit SecE [Acidobacteria bacterium]|nr:MAG: preprotein translocase subunit SecE [Acidobacteriota bacterium]